MASLRYIVPVLAAIGHATAQCGGSEPLKVQSSGDIPSACSTISGDMVISSDAAGTIDLGGVRQIEGDLSMENNGALTGLSANQLESIGKSFKLHNNTILSSMVFPRLTTVDSIDWIGLPGMQQLTFTTGVSMAGSVDIENTQFTTLDGINLAEVGNFVITNNPYLNDITMQLGNVSDAFQVNANGQQVNLQLPNLIWANNMTIGNVSEFSAPSLVAVNKSIAFRGCHFDTLYQANLTSIGGDLTLLVNDNLNNLSFPALTNIGGGLTVGDNVKLTKIDAFPKLKQIGGGVDLHGNFTEASLPALQNAKGALNVQSTDPNFDCSGFNKQANGIIKGQESCKRGVTNPSSNPNAAKTGGNGGSSGAAQLSVLSGVTSVLVVIAAVFGML